MILGWPSEGGNEGRRRLRTNGFPAIGFRSRECPDDCRESGIIWTESENIVGAKRRLLAEAVEEVGANRFCAIIVPVG